MYLILWTLLLLYVFTIKVPLLYSALCLAVYLFWWFDGRQYSGDGRWPAFQSFRLWAWLSPVEYEYVSQTDLEHTDGRRLYLVMDGTSLVWPMGMHGGQLRLKRPVHYVVQPALLWIPLVREWLQWTGAVTTGRHVSLTDLVTRLFDTGRNVCCLATEDNTALLELCRQQAVQVVPVVVRGEEERYRTVDCAFAQDWFYRPQVYWYRLFSVNKPPPLTVTFCSLYNASLYEDVVKLDEAVKQAVENVGGRPPPVAVVAAKATKGN